MATQTTRYQSALAAAGNLRPVIQRRPSQAPLTVDMLSADCKVVHLHEKPTVSMFKPSDPYMQKSSLLYTAKQPPISRASSQSIRKGRKRTTSPTRAVLQGSPSLRALQNVYNPTARKSLPGNSTETGGKVVCADLPGEKSLNSIESNASKTTKVFLSEKQSRSLKECGVLVPCAPPATPTPEHRQKFDFIPSLSDIRAQRHMRQRLEGITKSDPSLKKAEKKKEEKLWQEKMSIRERIADTKRRQRQEIYALNRIMTELEYKHFVDFVQERGFKE